MTGKDVAQGAADDAAAAAAAEAGSKATVSNVAGSQATTIEADAGKAAQSSEVTAESLGVNSQQFEKFYDKAKKSYNWEGHAKELAWQMSQKGTAKAADQAGTTTAQAEEAVTKAGLNMDALTTELATGGKLTEESLKALEAVGIPRETAQGYAQFIVGEAAKFQNEVKTYLGGDQGIATLKQWALANLKPDEIQKYEEKLSDPAEWRVYADSLKTRAGVRANGQAVHGGNAQGGGGVVPYANDTEMQADIRNPKYRTDPQFRNQVMQRARAMQPAAGSSRGFGVGR